jgi:hypothetical protein
MKFFPTELGASFKDLFGAYLLTILWTSHSGKRKDMLTVAKSKIKKLREVSPGRFYKIGSRF